MPKTTTKTISSYDIDIIKMIRNNNIPVGMDMLKGYNAYFMLDYFDLLFHKTLKGKDKIYTEFWNIRNAHAQEQEFPNYKAAYRTLSLYAQNETKKDDPFKISTNSAKSTLSNTPFLGIIQINLVYTVFDKELSVEDTLSVCEQKILEHLARNDAGKTDKTDYKMYRSSTSGDLCLVTRSASIEKIYQIAALINQLIIRHHNECLKFSTYTNVGIECRANKKGQFLSFHEDTVTQNEKCKFALRITSEHPFAKELIQKLQAAKEKEPALKLMEGLFGRYDFLLELSMREFSQIYSTLCTSKIAGYENSQTTFADYNSKSWLQLLTDGIESNKIQIINERALVPLSAAVFQPKEPDDVSPSDIQKLDDVEGRLKSAVKRISKKLTADMNEFQALENIFMEERRIFIDVSRALSEVISTYVPQGMDNDSHVNWQLLISDLEVAFSYITKWKESYDKCVQESDQKAMRVQFLNDIRLITDAINQYYKLLQNVNAQTWQSPLYEIQTQLDSEKMMIAYREFLYEYFFDYKERNKASDDPRPMLFPIVYPDMTIDIACANAVFQNVKELKSHLLICRVPSFEYYGRMFDMIPWILHEASHSVRTLGRKDRNDYLICVVMQNIFNQVLYKFFNKYSNDFGYHKLGALENDILSCIVNAATEEFKNFLQDKKKEEIDKIEINFLESELLEFLLILFDQNIYQLEEGEDAANIKGIQTTLCHFLAVLDILDDEITIEKENKKVKQSVISLVASSAENGDDLSTLLELLYNTYYEQLTGTAPAPGKWKILRQDSNIFEANMEKELSALQDFHIGEELLRDYCFTVREWNRLYQAWCKRKKDTPDETYRIHLWEQCYADIQEKIGTAFIQKKGFTELYRILNIHFGSQESSNHGDIQKISQTFNILLQEEIHKLVKREVTIYRESYADLYMAAALGFTAFGYCRQISQTTSDTAIENYVKWSEGINVHRFRAVTAVLLAQEYKDTSLPVIGGQKRIPMEHLLEQGKAYCLSSLECIKNSILDRIEKDKNQDTIENIFKSLQQSIDKIFEFFKQDTSVHDALEDSPLSIYLEPDKITASDEEVLCYKQEVANLLKPVQKELNLYRHVIHRIKCFIALLDLISENGQIILAEYEFDHLNALYQLHNKDCHILQEEAACKTVADFYNTPQSANAKSPEEMLEDTIRFIETYYYRNRFKIMSSDEIKKEIEE